MIYEIKGKLQTLPDYKEITYTDYVDKTGTHLYNNGTEMTQLQKINLVVVGIDDYQDLLLVEPHILENNTYNSLNSQETRFEHVKHNYGTNVNFKMPKYLTHHGKPTNMDEKHITDEITIWQWIDITEHELIGKLRHHNSLFNYFDTYQYTSGIIRKTITPSENKFTVMRIAPMGDNEPTFSTRGKKPFTYYSDRVHICSNLNTHTDMCKTEKYIRVDMGESICGNYSYIPLRCLYDAVYCVGKLTNGNEWHALENVYETYKEAEKALNGLK